MVRHFVASLALNITFTDTATGASSTNSAIRGQTTTCAFGESSGTFTLSGTVVAPVQ